MCKLYHYKVLGLFLIDNNAVLSSMCITVHFSLYVIYAPIGMDWEDVYLDCVILRLFCAYTYI